VVNRCVAAGNTEVADEEAGAGRVLRKLFSAAKVRVVANCSGSPTFATLLTRRVLRVAFPPALPISEPDAEGNGEF
jgi:hypothetical protein